MQKLKVKLLIIFLLLPAIAFANGEEIITTIFLQLISVIIFVVFIALIKESILNKIILLASYLLSTFILWYVSAGEPFRADRIKFEAQITIIPVAIVCLALIFIRLKSKKETIN